MGKLAATLAVTLCLQCCPEVIQMEFFKVSTTSNSCIQESKAIASSIAYAVTLFFHSTFLLPQFLHSAITPEHTTQILECRKEDSQAMQ